MISEVVDGLVAVPQAAAEVIAGIIGWIGDKITSLLVKLAVPLLGWAAGAAEVAATAKPFFDKLRKGYEVIKTYANNMVSVGRVANATGVDESVDNSSGTQQ